MVCIEYSDYNSFSHEATKKKNIGNNNNNNKKREKMVHKFHGTWAQKETWTNKMCDNNYNKISKKHEEELKHD